MIGTARTATRRRIEDQPDRRTVRVADQFKRSRRTKLPRGTNYPDAKKSYVPKRCNVSRYAFQPAEGIRTEVFYRTGASLGK